MRKFLLMALSLTGLFDSIYLLWEYTSPNHPMVCMGGGCDVVRASAYAHLGGLPVPLYGVFMYGTLVLLLFLYPLVPAWLARLTQYAVLLISGAGFLFSVYLTGIEAFVLHSYCTWCLLSAFLVTAIFLLAMVDRKRPAQPLEPAQALSVVQRNFALILFGVVLGVPAFILLTSQGNLPPAKSPPSKTVKAHLVRPDTHFFGNPKAPVTVVEFGDFKCPACREAEVSAKQIRQHFGNRIRFAFREFPLVGVHAQSEKAAEAAECAAQQGKFWQAVDMLYEHQQDLSVAALHRYAGDMGLDIGEFSSCLQKGEMVSHVEQDVKDGRALGVRATPTFFVDGHMIVGPIQYRQFKELIDDELAKHKEEAPAATASPKPVTQVKQPPTTKKPTVEKAAASPKKAATPPSESTMQVTAGSSNLFASLQNSAAACSEAEAKKRQPEMIGTSEAEKLHGGPSPAVFVDVRTTKAFQSGHIPGALNLTIDSFEQEWKRLPKNKRIVLYQGGESGGDVCAFSRSAGRVLLSHGYAYNNVKVYRDGLAGWTQAGLAVQH